MEKQQLYINGVAVDMPADSIKFKVESNILSDADKVMTAHSYTIVLPRTLRNDGIFKQAYIPAVNSGGDVTHTYLDASLYVDGVPMFQEGKAVLTKIDDKGYNISLVWGLVGVFDVIKEEGLKLNELASSAYWNESTMATWIKLTQYPDPTWQYNSGMSDIIYNTLDDDSKDLADAKPWAMPVVGAQEIINKIVSVYGVALDFSPWMQSEIARLYHPLNSLRSMGEDEKCTIRMLGDMVWNNNQWSLNVKQFVYDSNNDISFGSLASNINGATNGKIANNVLNTAGNHTIIYGVDAKKGVSIKSMRIRGSCELGIAFYKKYGSDEEIEVNGTWSAADSTYTIDYTFYDFKVEEGHNIFHLQAPAHGIGSVAPFQDLEVLIEVTEIEDADRGDFWCYERNYPNVSVMDYLSEILAHCGGVIVGSITKPASVKIMQLDEIAERTPTILDIQGVNTVEMSLNDLAQKNKYLHSENDDEDLPYLAEGVVFTNDNTIKVERDAFKSSFKVPRYDYIKNFSVERKEDSTKYRATWNDAGDYIAGVEDKTTYSLLCNTGQDFSRVIARNYIYYDKLAKRPKVVEVSARLTLVQLLSLDLGRPVYVPQLSRKYLVVSVESVESENYKFRMIQL